MGRGWAGIGQGMDLAGNERVDRRDELSEMVVEPQHVEVLQRSPRDYHVRSRGDRRQIAGDRIEITSDRAHGGARPEVSERVGDRRVELRRG